MDGGGGGGGSGNREDMEIIYVRDGMGWMDDRLTVLRCRDQKSWMYAERREAVRRVERCFAILNLGLRASVLVLVHQGRSGRELCTRRTGTELIAALTLALLICNKGGKACCTSQCK